MSGSLDGVADAAEALAGHQLDIARPARRMQRERDRGWSWKRVLDSKAPPGVVELARRSARHSARLVASLGVVIASGLSSEGLSRRQIAQRVAVRHQRVSAILGRSDDARDLPAEGRRA